MSLLDALLLDPAPLEIWIAYRTDGIKGSGTASDPYDGSTADRFDARMNELPANTHVHLGPKPRHPIYGHALAFETKGYADGVNGGWQPKPGMKITGAGIDATVLQLVGATVSGQFYAVGHALTTVIPGSPAVPNLLDFFEISDLTISCNLFGNADNLPLGGYVSCGAIRIMGNHCRIRRVKAVDWGSTHSSKPCFVISAITADPPSGVMGVDDAGIEDCVVVEPSEDAVSGTTATMIHAGGLGTGASREAFGKAPYIRHCFLDGGKTTPGTGTVLHGLSMSWCKGGVIEGNQIHNVEVGGPYQDKTSTREIIIRNNHYRNVLKGPFFNLEAYSASIGAPSLSQTGSLVTATLANHDLLTGDRVLITKTSPAYSKWAQITVTAANQFTYRSLVTVPNDTNSLQKLFGIDYLLIEGNVIALSPATSGDLIAIHQAALNPGSLQDADFPAYQHGQVVIRNNKIRYVDGAFQTSPAYVGTGIQANGARNMIVQDNVLECVPANPLRNEHCGTATYFNNRTPAGVLLRGLNEDTNTKYSELETEAEDALVMAMFNER